MRQLIENLYVLRETAGFVLTVDLVSVDDDIKNATTPLDQLGINIQLFLDRGRQTGGLRFVVSLRAISN